MGLKEPHEIYEYYDWKNHAEQRARLKRTSCLDCPCCHHSTVDFDVAGSVNVGYCDHEQTFLTLEEMDTTTMWDCFEDEI